MGELGKTPALLQKTIFFPLAFFPNCFFLLFPFVLYGPLGQGKVRRSGLGAWWLWAGGDTLLSMSHSHPVAELGLEPGSLSLTSAA